jgi:uncharacterized phosphosugar-binding protein
MAFTPATLIKLAGAEPALHIYTNSDAIATVVASGYFNTVTDNLKQNDVILVVGSTGGTRTVDVVCVTSATGAATVTTTALEGVTTS